MTAWHFATIMPSMKTVKDVIEALGGAGPVSEAVGVSPNTVVYWGIRRRIPLDHWDSLMAWATTQGLGAIDRDVLKAVCRPRRRRGSPSDDVMVTDDTHRSEAA